MLHAAMSLRSHAGLILDLSLSTSACLVWLEVLIETEMVQPSCHVFASNWEHNAIRCINTTPRHNIGSWLIMRDVCALSCNSISRYLLHIKYKHIVCFTFLIFSKLSFLLGGRGILSLPNMAYWPEQLTLYWSVHSFALRPIVSEMISS